MSMVKTKNIHFGEPQPEKPVKEYGGYHQSAAEQLDKAAARVPASEWRSEAACRHQPPMTVEASIYMRDKVFFARPKQEKSTVQLAKDICDSCPVIEKCLDYALTLRIEEGVWGGLTPSERRRARKKRNLLGE